MKKFLKNNKFAVIATSIFLVFVILLVQVKNTFFPTEGNAIYGDRLDGINNSIITSDDIKDIKNALEKETPVKKIEIRSSGRTLEVTVTINDDVDMNTAKSLAGKILEVCSDKQKKYYDFQVFIKKDNDAKDFPIIGYKHHNKENFTFTKDRAVN